MSLLGATEALQDALELSHRLEQAQLDSSDECSVSVHLSSPGKPLVYQEVRAKGPATASSLHGDVGTESDFEAIAGEAPQALFHSSNSLTDFAKRYPHGTRWPLPLEKFLQDDRDCSPLCPGIGLGRRDMRGLLVGIDKDPKPIWGYSSRSILSGLMVIDCFKKRVVPAEPGCEYVALSYVWGKIARLAENDGFEADLQRRRLPQTVQDAMNVVRVLGMRFLWVDRFCIDGMHPETEHYMISNMDAIYEAADLTIVAACGIDGDHGLPSVSRSYKTLGNGRIPSWDGVVETQLSHRDLEQIESSAWSTRGWTYQEGLLSRRRLVFTENCAILHFRGEDRVRASSGIFAHINEYSRRSLTYQSDLLKAFLGVFRAYERLQPPAMHLWGIPFLLTSDGAIRHPGYGLLWRARRNCSLHRLEGLPSWTWAGWSGWSANDATYWGYVIPFSQQGPYDWLLEKAGLRSETRSWGPSDISLGILTGGQLTDIVDYFRAGYVLSSCKNDETTPVLYLTAWSTTVTAFISPTLDVYLPGVATAIATLDPTVESLCKGKLQVNGCLSCEWTAAVICWGVTSDHARSLRTQSLLLERVGNDTYRRVGVLETDWRKPGLGDNGHSAASWPIFTRRCVRLE